MALKDIALMVQPALAEDLGNGIAYELRLNGQSAVFTFSSLARSAIITWVEAQVRLMKDWPAERPIRILVDQSALDHVTFTPYMKTRFPDLTSAATGKHGRSAIVVGKHFFMQLVTMLVKNLDTGNMTIRFFRDRDEALAWLKETIQEETVTTAN